ncbi:hypothetical protein [Pectobacterium brasiliense]|uniref:hypothetical protein n=1 Tax=Pectobacterium brasiliense TaxID=180957 RepID=UPI001968FB79|nr:hypothetical protein [Pectobacterium brasiliense]MBN3262979.1 hypothetical protein [Pectobacterium brasiliense]
MSLDFSDLTDDQLIELARACCEEAMRRNPAAQQAMRDMMLSEAEKARIAKNASELEIRSQRARERERIAKEATAKARYDEEARIADARAKSAQEAIKRTRDSAEQRKHRAIALLRQAAELTHRAPDDLGIVYCKTNRGVRVMINPNSGRYTNIHLVDYYVETEEIHTVQALVKSKTELAAFCAGVAAGFPLDTFIAGCNYSWPS